MKGFTGQNADEGSARRRWLSVGDGIGVIRGEGTGVCVASRCRASEAAAVNIVHIPLRRVLDFVWTAKRRDSEVVTRS